MAHKYDDRYTKGGIAYHQRVCTWGKRYSARNERHQGRLELDIKKEDYTGDWARRARRSWWYVVVFW